MSDLYTLYAIYHAAKSSPYMEYLVQSDNDPPPARVVDEISMRVLDGKSYARLMYAGLPQHMADGLARGGRCLVMQAVVGGRTHPLSRGHAAAIIGAMATGKSDRKLRSIVNALGHGGSSADLDWAIGRAMMVPGIDALIEWLTKGS